MQLLCCFLPFFPLPVCFPGSQASLWLQVARKRWCVRGEGLPKEVPGLGPPPSAPAWSRSSFAWCPWARQGRGSCSCGCGGLGEGGRGAWRPKRCLGAGDGGDCCAPGCCRLLAPGSSWCYGFILAEPSWRLGVSEVAGLLLLGRTRNLWLRFRVPYSPSLVLREGRQQLYFLLTSASSRRRCLCLLWIYTCLHIQVVLVLTLLGHSEIGCNASQHGSSETASLRPCQSCCPAHGLAAAGALWSSGSANPPARSLSTTVGCLVLYEVPLPFMQVSPRSQLLHAGTCAWFLPFPLSGELICAAGLGGSHGGREGNVSVLLGRARTGGIRETKNCRSCLIWGQT